MARHTSASSRRPALTLHTLMRVIERLHAIKNWLTWGWLAGGLAFDCNAMVSVLAPARQGL